MTPETLIFVTRVYGRPEPSDGEESESRSFAPPTTSTLISTPMLIRPPTLTDSLPPLPTTMYF